MSRYESGEISYADFKQELEQAEQCCNSDMSSNACDNDFDRDEAEFLEAVAILPFIEAMNALAATLIGI